MAPCFFALFIMRRCYGIRVLWSKPSFQLSTFNFQLSTSVPVPFCADRVKNEQGNEVTVLSPYRHPLVTSHPIESQWNKRKGDEVTVIKQHPHTLLLLFPPGDRTPTCLHLRKRLYDSTDIW